LLPIYVAAKTDGRWLFKESFMLPQFPGSYKLADSAVFDRKE